MTRRGLVLGGGGVLGAAWLPTDGYLDPSGLTLALVGAAIGATVNNGE